MKKFFINKVLQFIFRPKFKTNNDDHCAYLFSRESLDGYWYYLKLVPCDRWGLFPVAGVFTEKEILEYDKKAYEKNMKAAIEFSKKINSAFPTTQEKENHSDFIFGSVKYNKNDLN